MTKIEKAKISLEGAEKYIQEMEEISVAADRAKNSVEELDAAMEKHERRKVPNNGSGFRSKECPTGEEMNYILKFWFGFISDNFKEYNRILETKVKKIEKMIAVLAITNTAIIAILIKAYFSDNQ